MSAPLTGSKKQTASGWFASVPKARGATARASATFKTEASADRWLALAVADVAAGRPITEPSNEDLTRPRRQMAATSGTSFRTMGTRWIEERYEEMRLAGTSRQTSVTTHVRTISDWMEAKEMTMETMVRAEVKAFQAFIARKPDSAEVATVPDGLDPKGLVTLNQALHLPSMNASRSTLKRRIKDGLIVAAVESRTGNLYAIEDFYAEEVLRTSEGGLRRGPRRTAGYDQDVISDILWVFDQVSKFAADHGVAVPQDRASLGVHRTDKAPTGKRTPLSLRQSLRIAGRLHAVHQSSLWLMRVLGLRIGEAYGIDVEHVVDNGPGKPGVIAVRAQGGKLFDVRDSATGATVKADRIDTVKTRNSYRVLVVPPMVMDVIRAVVEVFHTDADGIVDQSARLIPGLEKKNAGGQAGFRSALAAAARAEGIDCGSDEDSLDAVFSCTPHDMRRSIMTDLNTFVGVKTSHARRFAGHAAGPDVHHRSYVLDDPELKPMRAIAKKIQKELESDAANGLLVPTMVRCTTGNQRALQPDAARIDARLEELGWLVVESNGDDLMLCADQVAAELGVTGKTARQWMREGVLPSVVHADRARGQERRTRLSEVIEFKSEQASIVTVHVLAAEVEQPYHTVYQYVAAQGIELVDRGERGKAVPAVSAERIRAHYAKQAALHARAVPLSVAAADLDVSVNRVVTMVNAGILIADDRAHDGRRMVTRASLEAEVASRRDANTKRQAAAGPRADLIEWDEARAILGLTNAQIDSLVAEGGLVQEQHRRRRHLTRFSVLTHLVATNPDRLHVDEVS